MVIDLEHHLAPREIWERRGGKPGQMVLQHAPDGTPLRPLDDSTHDVAIHLEDMDIAGIDMAVLSGTEVGTLDDVRLFNDNFSNVIQRLNAEMLSALAAKDVHDTLSNQGLDSGGTSPEQFARFIASEIEKWSPIVKASGIKVD